MKKIIIILMLSLCFSGCSLINPLKLNNKTNPKKQTAISKSSEVINYRDKEAGIDYQVKRTNYNKDISKYKIQEKIGSYIAKRGLFFLIIILIINWFVPGFIGWFIGFFLNASRNALKETVKAVQKYKDENKKTKDGLVACLDKAQDKKTKRYISKVKGKYQAFI